MKKLLLILGILAMQASLSCLFAQDAAPAYGDLPPIHVDGNNLRDEAGNKVVLHGIMDTPSPYFNSWRWGNAANDANVTNCITYFNRLFKAETDHSQRAYCNLFRLHLDPCWTNDNSVNAPGFKTEGGKTIDPLGQEVGGEADVHHYSGTKLTKYLTTVYCRIALQAMKNGMYVIMRPPGVCPGKIQVGTYYQDYLLDVWDRVSKNKTVLEYYGHIGLELANEPVSIRNAAGSENDDKRFHDFFQPIVDKIRANGFKGIIWIPGSVWQQEYRPYSKYPITDPLNNIGYAVHDYPGWYDLSDESYNYKVGIESFGRSIPMVRTNPIVITEIDWSPQKPGTGHYNESGKWVESNYGTWATASTSKWGNAFKKVKDFYGNVSMTLSGSHCYFDWDTYKNSNYKTVVPAFPGITEACGETCFDWYEDYAKENYASFERYQNIEYPEDPFERSDAWFDPYVFNPMYEENKVNKSNSAKHASLMSTLTMIKGGYQGWKFDNVEGIDLSNHKTLKLTLAKSASKGCYLRIYDNSCNVNFFANYHSVDLYNKKEVEVDLHNMEGVQGGLIDPAHIRIVCIGSENTATTLYIKSVTLEGGQEEPTHSHEFATEWTTDDNAHWHTCIGQVATCDIIDYSTTTESGAAYGAHEYSDIDTETSYYTCGICMFESALRKEEYDIAVEKATSIIDVNSKVNPTDVTYYTINGAKIKAPIKGLNIVRDKNGKTKKVVR